MHPYGLPEQCEIDEMNQKLVERMLEGAAMFGFMTSKNELRIAFGTLNQMIIPKFKNASALVVDLYEAMAAIKDDIDHLPLFNVDSANYKNFNLNFERVSAEISPPKKETVKAPNPDVQVYYDLEKNSWRSYNISKLSFIINP